MTKYRVKPIVIDATLWKTHGDHERVRHYASVRSSREFLNKELSCCGMATAEHGWINNRESGHIVCPNDWIVTGVDGEPHPCNPKLFELTYEKVEQE